MKRKSLASVAVMVTVGIALVASPRCTPTVPGSGGGGGSGADTSGHGDA